MKNTRFIFILSTAALVAFVIILLFFFGSQLSSHKNTDIESKLHATVEPNYVSFQLQMEEQIKKVQTLADFLGENWDAETRVKESLLRSAVKNNGLLRCALAFPDGSFITHDGKNEGSVAQDAFFQANMNGEFFITDPRPAVVDKTKTVILFTAPIFDTGKKVLGSMIYSYLCDDLNKIFNLKSMDGKMSLVVVKKTGELLIGHSEFASHQENFGKALVENCTHKGHTPETCFSIVENSATHVISHEGLGEPLYVLHKKLSYNDWYIVATVSESAATASISFVTQNQQQLSIYLACGALLYLSILLCLWLFQRKSVDTATGAPTLYAFKRASRKILREHKGEPYVVVKLDIKDFKLINRIYSFAMGDKVIQSVAHALESILDPHNSTFARVGVDSYVLLLPYQGSQALAEKRKEFIGHFCRIVDQPFSNKIIFPTGQYVLKPNDFIRPDIADIFEKVNFAHRGAKQRSDVIIDYEEDIENTALFVKKIEDRMEEAIAAKEFTLYLQPKIRLRDETLCGAEALVRWRIGDKFYMYPTDFIPVLEQNGFIVQLDLYMFRCAAAFIRECIDKGTAPIPIAVNFSRHHLRTEGLIDQLCAIADEYQTPRNLLEIEVTESAFMGNTKDIISLIDAAHAAGFLFSMDDFGSGYSCFAQLKDLQIDVLKIDRGFFTKSFDENRARIVVAGIIQIAKNLHITTVAEGIEDAAQVAMLKELGCDIAQGYYYARAMPASQLNIENYLESSMENRL